MGVRDVAIEPIAGELIDHYDPTAKAVRLSEGIYGSTSFAAAAIPAHECGHVLPDKSISHLLVEDLQTLYALWG